MCIKCEKHFIKVYGSVLYVYIQGSKNIKMLKDVRDDSAKK